MAVSSFIQVLSLKCDVETVVKMPCHLVWYCNGSGLGWGKEEFSIALMKLCLCANRSCSMALTSFSALPSGTSHLFAGRLCTVLICFNASLLSDLIAIFFYPVYFPSPSGHSREILGTSLQGRYDNVLLPVNFGNNGLRRLYGECVGNTFCPKLFAYPILLLLHIFFSKQQWCSEGHCQEIVWIPMRKADIFIEILESRFPPFPI